MESRTRERVDGDMGRFLLTTYETVLTGAYRQARHAARHGLCNRSRAAAAARDPPMARRRTRRSPILAAQYTFMHNRPMHNRVMDIDAPAESLMIAVEQVVRYVRQNAIAGGLSTAASSALARLGREGAHRLTELARAEGVSQPNMTQLVTRMERAGLVRRVADRHDGRAVLVEATDTGLEVFRQRRAERAQALDLLVEELTEPEQQAVKIALPALARAIQDRQARS